ncbi:carbohydrate kinase family protein [Propionivibrio soli]|uniref:carbohydrate kinase family protein n=1 Tax=Propionivibrio soli TaxID=2976531 RepID=UPI0021E79DD3
MKRRGILCGGCWLVDHNNTISHWPEQETLTQIVAREIQGGGPAHNMALDLARLAPGFPVSAAGVVGNDDAGRLLIAACARHGIEHCGLHVLDGVGTSHTDVMTVRSTGKRTFFHHQGANALLGPEHFDFSTTAARILHLGAPGIHARMDAAGNEEANGWVTVLRRARAAGLRTNLEMISGEPEEVRRLVTPCLQHLDSLIINDYEAGVLTGIDIVSGGMTSAGAARRAAVALLVKGPLELVAIHFPGGCVAATRDGEVIARPSLDVPPEAIKGANGAGDAFAAGVLYGLHEGWPVDECLSLGLCAAASALRSVSTTESVGTVAECRALADMWGWRAPI